MANNRFYTVLVIPEAASKIRKLVLPQWTVKGFAIAGFLTFAVAIIMLIDYWYVISQIEENNELRMENRQLRQQVQVYQNKMTSIEETMQRIDTFSTRLKVITNIEERDNLSQNILDSDLPDAATNISNANANSKPKQEPLSPEELKLQENKIKLEDLMSATQKKTLLAEQNLQDLYELLTDQKTFLSALPTRRPSFGIMTSGFGIRSSPFGEGEKMHEGLDITNSIGTPVRATAYGVVSFAGSKPGYGRTVIIDHGFGLETLYGHASQIVVKEGDKVKRGQKISLMGNTGRSTGSHVHYEVRVKSIPVDPLSYILED
jgi:murein DD-endopeptidase MepM/ murein hydrolase activator NlpD